MTRQGLCHHLLAHPVCQLPTTMFAFRSWLCKTSLGLKPFSAITGQQRRSGTVVRAHLSPHRVFASCRHKDLLLQELVSLSAEEVYTILCLPAMSQEHVLTAPLSEGRHSAITFNVVKCAQPGAVLAPGKEANALVLPQAPASEHLCNSWQPP